MLSVLHRVSSASVQVGDEMVGSIGAGLVALVAVCQDDEEFDVQWTARKLVELRIFRNGDKHFDLDVKQSNGSILLVSNFTVAAATRQGRRPSFVAAADGQKGQRLFAALVEAVRATGVPVQTGRFGADMQVYLVNDGPVTVLLNSAESPTL